MSTQHLYKVIFHNQGKIFEIYAAQVYQSEMHGFIELEDLVFSDRSQVLVDPSEEKLKAEFDSVKRTYIPLHSIVRIDEVEKKGAGKIFDLKESGSVTPFKGTFTPPPRPEDS